MLAKEAAITYTSEFSTVAKKILRHRIELGGEASKVALLNFLNDKDSKIEDSLDSNAPPGWLFQVIYKKYIYLYLF